VRSRDNKQEHSVGKLPLIQIQPKTIYVGFGNNARMIQKYFQSLYEIWLIYYKWMESDGLRDR
jgi:hypothetical protein